MQYHVHLATGPDRFSEVENQPREYAGYVEANSPEEAFKLSQNVEKPWNSVNPCRSSSVGDILQGEEFYMVCGRGFRKL